LNFHFLNLKKNLNEICISNIFEALQKEKSYFFDTLWYRFALYQVRDARTNIYLGKGKYMANTIALNKIQRLADKSVESETNQFIFGQKVGLITTLFGCWHNNISRPFVNGKIAYRSCLQCGARKRFNPETLKTEKNFYFPPVSKDLKV
jgi:hypothetical protein